MLWRSDDVKLLSYSQRKSIRQSND